MISFHLVLRLKSVIFFFWLLYAFLPCSYLLTHTCHFHRPSHHPHFDHPNHTSLAAQLKMLLAVQFSPVFSCLHTPISSDTPSKLYALSLSLSLCSSHRPCLSPIKIIRPNHVLVCVSRQSLEYKNQA